MSAWWLLRRCLQPSGSAGRRHPDRLRTAAESAAGLDHVLAQAAVLLARARAVRDHEEVQRLLRWIDDCLEERLRLTRL